MFSSGLLCIDTLMLSDQQNLYLSDLCGPWISYQKQCPIGTEDERTSRESVLSARLNNDDNNDDDNNDDVY